MMNKKLMIYGLALLLLGCQRSSQADVTFKNASKVRNLALVTREIMSDKQLAKLKQHQDGFNPYHIIILEPGSRRTIGYGQKDYGFKNLEIVAIQQFVDYSKGVSIPEQNVHQTEWEVYLNRSGRKPTEDGVIDLTKFSQQDLLNYPIRVQDKTTYTVYNNDNDVDEMPYLSQSVWTKERQQ